MKIKDKDITENQISRLVVESCLKIHRALGPGLLEKSYEECLYYELIKEGLKVERQKALPLVYEDVQLDAGYRVDLLVEDKVIIEIKSVELLNDVHLAQVLTYLKLSGCQLGMLVNFNVPLIKKGIKRVVNNFKSNRNQFNKPRRAGDFL